MKKIIAIFMLVFVLAGCNNNEEAEKEVEAEVEVQVKEEVAEESSDTTEEVLVVEDPTTFIYVSENGDIELPSNPERIVVLDSSAMGAMIMFDGDVVGHEVWSGGNPLFAEGLEQSTEVAVDNLEQIIALQPDLIITSAYNENYEELTKIAPTVSVTYGNLNYTDTIIEYGKMVNQETAAKAWVEGFKLEAEEVGIAIKDKYGDDVSVSVIESYGDEMYLYGDNWGRGTQILYQEMGLQMTDAVQEVALTDGYYAISAEVVPDYAADLMIFTYFIGSNLSFETTETWTNIEAVKNNLVLKIEAESFYMTGPISLGYQLDTIEAYYLK